MCVRRTCPGSCETVALAAHVLPVDSGVPYVRQARGLDCHSFVMDGLVSIIGDLVEWHIRVLQDSGASQSIVCKSVLPFSKHTDTGGSVLIRGLGLSQISVPLHKMYLQSELVDGKVVAGVRPSLPVEGVDIILGHELVGLENLSSAIGKKQTKWVKKEGPRHL